MLSAGLIKDIRSLQLSKFRELHRTFVAEGPRIVEEFAASGQDILEIYALKEWVESDAGLKLAEKYNINPVTEKELERISSLSTPNKVLALLRIPGPAAGSLVLKDNLSLMLDDIRDPGNMGTILRSADWFGITNVICSPDCVDIYNPKVVQATMGSLARVKVIYTTLSEYLGEHATDIKTWAFVLDGNDIREIETGPEGIILIGNESRGIRNSLLPFVTGKIRIPEFYSGMRPRGAESLNASVATAIACYEFRRGQATK